MKKKSAPKKIIAAICPWLGDSVKCQETGYRGKITAVVFYTENDPRARVESLNKHTGGINEEWIDLLRLELVVP